MGYTPAVHRAVCNLADTLIQDYNIKSAYKVISPTCVAKLTNTYKPRRNSNPRSFVLTIGKPNYAVRRVIARLQCAGAKFPISATFDFSYKRHTR